MCLASKLDLVEKKLDLIVDLLESQALMQAQAEILMVNDLTHYTHKMHPLAQDFNNILTKYKNLK